MYINIDLHAHACIHLYAFEYACMYACLSLCLCTHSITRMCVCGCMCFCLWVGKLCVYVCIYTHTHIYTYTHTYRYTCVCVRVHVGQLVCLYWRCVCVFECRQVAEPEKGCLVEMLALQVCLYMYPCTYPLRFKLMNIYKHINRCAYI